ncbi:D-alanyl-D-alanine carboxypeptidase (penicillin-binding protein 5/6) [Planomicrobium stackebrandtii]|uniref:serine-type D-Ala-D-Ala carboxypeptidase n=1 Tax=Planomicrobium stackebrandtii TaxID=253160 RepID=A0ABU0H1G1_9BACL|nr:D-alanyl-D-alanine carboxypeptidase family protein [Planomicrobium stackebrandtii]MDQ0430896.1 D-alanyl-D-alanine carboxypeptidase (penicillin-binding protein 5/6) [Planomicrobium stackebrandtii]
MKKIFNKGLLTALLAALTLTAIVPQQAQAEESLNIMAEAAILVDAESGKILYEKNAETPLGVASMTKMMTEYLLFEAIEEGRVTWDQEYQVTDYAYQISQDMRLSNVPFREDGVYTVKEMYEAMAIFSANAATIGIAETIAGTESEFVRLMNEKAEEMGLEETTFVNSTGLSNSSLMGMHPEETEETGENIMPARSVAKLTKILLDDYPEVLDTTKIPVMNFREGTVDETRMENWNSMLPGLIYEYEGVDGLKTGSTDFAGYSFAGTATRDDTRFITVVMGAVDNEGEGSYKARFEATRALFDFGFGQFTTEEIIPAGYQFEGQETLAVEKGVEEEVAIAVKEPVSMMIRTADKDMYQPELQLDDAVVQDGKLEAAVEKDLVVGTLQLTTADGTDYGYLSGSGTKVEVATTESVERANWASLAMRDAGGYLSSLWDDAGSFVKGLF